MDDDELDDVARFSIAGDLDALADALVRRATTRLDAGAFADAASDLERAAEIHHAAGRSYDEARLTHARATALRAAGQLDAALACARQATQLAPEASPARVSAETELGEGHLMAGRTAEAIGAYRTALDHGVRAGLSPIAQAALYRRIALAHSIAGEHAAASAAAQRAAELYAEAGHAGGTAAASVEAATALVAAGLYGPADRAIARARESAGQDAAALADVELIEVARAIASRDVDGALRHARAARSRALEGGAVLAYVGAALAIAELLEDRDDRAGAYESLAVGWVTTADKIGQAHAAALFQPRLAELRARWGAAAFDAVKDAYYAARRTT